MENKSSKPNSSSSNRKKQSLKDQRRAAEQRAAQRRTMLWILGGVIVVAIIVVVLLIAQGARPQQTAGEFTAVPTQTWPMADGKAMGPKDSKVVVTEFADFQCPYCKRFQDTIKPQIIDTYVRTGKIRFEFHHFIVIDANVGGNESRRAAEASDCANDQGKFWDYFNILFANQGSEASGAYSDARLKAFAGSLGLDTAKFNTCLDTNQFAQQVKLDEGLAISNGLNSTPSLLVNKTLVQNPMDWNQVKTAIDAALKQ